jgi:REP element-mobilizing transposase RayT
MYQRKNLRLKHYDYSKEGFYFITICGQNKMKYFGEVDNNIVVLNEAGLMIDKVWSKIPLRFPFIKQYEYVVMPNHFHTIIEITDKTDMILGDVIAAFKSLTTNSYIKGVHRKNWMLFEKKLWQRNYYEHVIRNEKSYVSLSEYINNNPLKWEEDTFYM